MIRQSFEKLTQLCLVTIIRIMIFGTPEQSKGLVLLLGHMTMITLSEVY